MLTINRIKRIFVKTLTQCRVNTSTYYSAFAPTTPIFKMPLKLPSIDLVYEDNDVVIVNKPAAFLTIPDRYDIDKPNLYHVLQDIYGEIYVVHRLDFETSGILCFARNEVAHKLLSMQFSRHTIIKSYRAIVSGRFLQQEGEINLPIGEDYQRRGTMRIDHREGKPALSRYRVVEEFKHYAYIEVNILTGRTHQIRVHLKAIAHPVLGDTTYGGQADFRLSSIKKRYNLKQFEEEQPIMSRTALHAHALTFVHPSTQEEVCLSVPLPKDMDVVLRLLQKYDI